MKGDEHVVKATLFKNSSIVPKTVSECDLLENVVDDSIGLKYDDSSKEVSFEIKPYEIVTIRAII